MKYFFINSGTPSEIRAALSRFGICVPLPPLPSLPEPIRRHPDMLMAKLDEVVFLHREYREAQDLLRSAGIPFRLSEKRLGASYPEDIALNCFCVGNALFAGRRGASPDVIAWAQESGKTVVPVRQGYAKCSTIVAGGAIASADKGIVRAATEVNVPALLLPPHPIGIEVYDTGFLGGACGLIHENLLGFFGKIEDHPSYRALADFFSRFGVTLLSLSDAPLFDLGGMISVERSPRSPVRNEMLTYD